MEDSEDLEALFDSIVQNAGDSEATDKSRSDTVHQTTTERPTDEQTQIGSISTESFSKIGQMTRDLFNALRELGYDKAIERAVFAIPDANDRIAYIATLTQKAAERVLDATDIAKPIQDRIGDRAQQLSSQWQKVFDNKLSVEEFKELAMQTRDYLKDVPHQVKATNDQLTEIMMAQDFQDLTGQVIKKVVELVRSIESQLICFLVENAPPHIVETSSGLLNGPVINAEGRLDVVTNQAQVDDLLESLGF